MHKKYKFYQVEDTGFELQDLLELQGFWRLNFDADRETTYNYIMLFEDHELMCESLSVWFLSCIGTTERCEYETGHGWEGAGH